MQNTKIKISILSLKKSREKIIIKEIIEYK